MSAPRPAFASTAAVSTLAARIDAALPQTQCTRCGYPDCATYARAIAEEGVPINQCPPGGAEGIARLAAITGQAPLPLSAEHGVEAPRTVAHIDEAWCIGCTLCIKACPTDAIVGSHKKMHTVIEPYCTGCELCIPVCPVDCIQLENASGSATGWAGWSAPLAQQARQRYQAHRERLPLDPVMDEGEEEEAPGASAKDGAASSAQVVSPAAAENAQAARQAVIAAAMERARQRRLQGPQ
ncbi:MULTISPECIES: electron transport complex subunit RsxB [Acidovorax]|uniref:Electron transport complex subunit RsxB n=1 Tax=Acidovorax facilis TaxID=12917 RepID=A0ABV8DED4_9BURK|nr:MULTISPECIES: electron transport complex subunit RsxB [Acidovorax]KQB58817.1 ferredoxin [Acidovorax sp. SD340]MBO1006451.1 electron transport complex subunit RsxB [Acidovorax sp. SD340]MCO4240934.1 electron transport complex subunit RsxB [Acidovorax facilis]